MQQYLQVGDTGKTHCSLIIPLLLWWLTVQTFYHPCKRCVNRVIWAQSMSDRPQNGIFRDLLISFLVKMFWNPISKRYGTNLTHLGPKTDIPHHKYCQPSSPLVSDLQISQLQYCLLFSSKNDIVLENRQLYA